MAIATNDIVKVYKIPGIEMYSQLPVKCTSTWTIDATKLIVCKEAGSKVGSTEVS
jgi:hypothetical protein